MHSPRCVTVALTGASGLPYGLRLIACLLEAGCSVSIIVSKAARIVAKEEMGWVWPSQPNAWRRWLLEHLDSVSDTPLLRVFGEHDWLAPMASGSGVEDAMVICPCTMGTIGAIAAGIGDSLIERSADVILKERRLLVLVPRETPFSTLHLENLLKLSRMGVAIVPPIPAFYHQPKSLEDMVDFVVSRLLDQLGIHNTLIRRWGEAASDDRG
jgi:flavin prenyltransferase